MKKSLKVFLGPTKVCARKKNTRIKYLNSWHLHHYSLESKQRLLTAQGRGGVGGGGGGDYLRNNINFLALRECLLSYLNESIVKNCVG